MSKTVITEHDVKQYSGNEPIRVTQDVVITPSAIDRAHMKGIEVIYDRDEEGTRESGPGSKSNRSDFEPSNPGYLQVRIPDEAGKTFVVKMTSDGPQVFESTEDGLKHLKIN